MTNCGACHTLAKAGTDGVVGPNLDELLAPPSASAPDPATIKPRVLSAINNGDSGSHAEGRAQRPAGRRGRHLRRPGGRHRVRSTYEFRGRSRYRPQLCAKYALLAGERGIEGSARTDAWDEGPPPKGVLLSHAHRRPRKRGRMGLALVLGLVAALSLTLLPGVADAKGKSSKGGHQLTVMTRNLYLGADLTPALNAPDVDGAVDAAYQIEQQVHRTKFPSVRAGLLAKEIQKAKPDIVGLQEAAWWRTGPYA